ncbi:hypothetical protein AX284_04005 [Pseudomonas sp. HUK17]|nr:hypothetical protein AX284_04005 [Pseudomonas sp. HUK17]
MSGCCLRSIFTLSVRIAEAISQRAQSLHHCSAASQYLLKNHLFMLRFCQVEQRGCLLVELVEIRICFMLAVARFFQDMLADGLKKRPGHGDRPLRIRSTAFNRFSPSTTYMLGVESVHRLRHHRIRRMYIADLSVISKCPELIPYEASTFRVRSKFWLYEAPELI